MHNLTSFWMQFWFTPKSPTPMSLFRILFGIIVIQCLCVHYAADFYLLFSDHAMLPIETIANVKWRQDWILDLMLLLPQGDSWKMGFFIALCALSFTLTLGLATRLSAFLLMLGLISLHHHSGWCYNAGDHFMLLALMLLSVSNAGDAFSLDSIARGMKEDWRIVGFEPPLSAPWAQRLLQVNLALAYAHSFFSKISGQIWIDGSAVYYSSRFRDFFRMPLPVIADYKWGCVLLTWMTLLVEGAFPFLVWVPEMRYLVLLAGVILQLGIDWMMNIPNFEWLFMVTYVCFVDPADLTKVMNKIKAGVSKREGSPLLAYFDGESKISVKLAGIAQRLDVFGRFHFLDYRDKKISSALPEDLPVATDTQIFIQAGSNWLHGLPAFCQAINKLPLLWIVWPLFNVPGFGLIGGTLFSLAARPVCLLLNKGKLDQTPTAAISSKQVLMRVTAAIGFILIAVCSIQPFQKSAWISWRQENYAGHLDKELAAAEKQEAITHSLPENDETRLIAQETLADIYCRAEKVEDKVPAPRLVDAERLYTDIWLARDKMSSEYDPKFVKVMLKLAAVHIDLDKLEDAVNNYQSIYSLDRKFDANTDRRVARDLNNLGLVYYLSGLSHEHFDEGKADYTKANEYLSQALVSYSAICGPNSQEAAMVLNNQYLVLRDMRLVKEAASVKLQADIIYGLIKRSSTAP